MIRGDGDSKGGMAGAGKFCPYKLFIFSAALPEKFSVIVSMYI